jgi:hypothetical protein
MQVLVCNDKLNYSYYGLTDWAATQRLNIQTLRSCDEVISVCFWCIAGYFGSKCLASICLPLIRCLCTVPPRLTACEQSIFSYDESINFYSAAIRHRLYRA